MPSYYYKLPRDVTQKPEDKKVTLTKVPDLKVDGGLLSRFARTELSPNSCLRSSLGVKGRLVQRVRRDCLASLTISALVFL